MSEITLENIRDEVVKIADKRPDFVYPVDNDRVVSCVYNATSDLPCCIFGEALTNLGYPVSPEYEGNNIWYVLDMNDIGPQDDAGWALYNAFSDVQRDQDQGKTWSEAVSRLKEMDNE